MSTTILICDHNQATHKSLLPYLEEAKFKHISVYSGQETLDILQYSHVDLLILDMTLPDIYGLDMLRNIFAIKELPVVCLSTKDSELDRIVPLELGAADLVKKPFYPREVILRAKKILNHTKQNSSRHEITYSNLKIDTTAHTVYINEFPLNITPMEFHLLELFANHPGKIFSREEILRSIWHDTTHKDIRNVDTHIKRIRKKIPITAMFDIYSVYGIGYKLDHR